MFSVQKKELYKYQGNNEKTKNVKKLKEQIKKVERKEKNGIQVIKR